MTAPGKRPRYELRDWVTPEALNVAPALMGAPLARPVRRAAAMAMDLLVLSLLSALANLWWLAAAVTLALGRRRQQQRGASTRRLWSWWLAAGLLAGAGLWQSLQTAATAFDPPSAAGETAGSVLRAASAVAAATSASAVDLEAQLKVAALEAEVARLRAREAQGWSESLQQWAEDLGLGYGWALVYFTMLPARWNGQTVGKRCLGLRVVELSGRPITPLLCLKRFGGYAAGLATGGLGLAQVWWDPNRQALQDRAAHTVVIDLRLPRRLDLGA